MTTYVNSHDRHEGEFHQVSSLEMTVKEALEQGVLDQIPDHIGDCSDDNLRPRGKLTSQAYIGPQDLVRCPRCMLLLCSQPTASGIMLNSKLKLRVVVQIEHDSVFNHIRWD